KVVFHCFSGDYLFAEKVWNMGWYISFTGAITYPKNEQVKQILMNIPENKLMVETDCPYLTPVPHRGKRNDPLHLHLVIEKIADLTKRTPKSVAEITYKNAMDFFY
ncbi:MAG: TatD family hydrolase, partial [Candidatus Cloacimonetes bacterium]|nr:TatD family hydrolase [Candidatus Cloacimonadota bacterium]